MGKAGYTMTLSKTVYRHYRPAGKGAGILPLVADCRTLEVGVGSGALLCALKERGNDVYGVDAGQDIVEAARAQGFERVYHVDVSEEPLPFEDDFFDAVYCYEVLEHLTNPHRLLAEIRRVLKPGARLFFSVPAQEVDMGYGVMGHTFVYPGLLERPNLERFLMQMYFRIERFVGAGPTDWLLGYNYVLVNMKKPDQPDVVEVITQDVCVAELYADVLDEEALRREIDRELARYEALMNDCIKRQDVNGAAAYFAFLRAHYPREHGFYLRLAERFGALGHLTVAKEILAWLYGQPGLPLAVQEDIRSTLKGILADLRTASDPPAV